MPIGSRAAKSFPVCPSQMISDAEFPIQRQDHFAIGMRGEWVSVRILRMQSRVVVHFAIAHQPHAPVRAVEGLVAGMAGVHDGQAVEGEGDGTVRLHQFGIIGTAMAESVETGPELGVFQSIAHGTK